MALSVAPVEVVLAQRARCGVLIPEEEGCLNTEEPLTADFCESFEAYPTWGANSVKITKILHFIVSNSQYINKIVAVRYVIIIHKKGSG